MNINSCHRSGSSRVPLTMQSYLLAWKKSEIKIMLNRLLVIAFSFGLTSCVGYLEYLEKKDTREYNQQVYGVDISKELLKLNTDDSYDLVLSIVGPPNWRFFEGNRQSLIYCKIHSRGPQLTGLFFVNNKLYSVQTTHKHGGCDGQCQCVVPEASAYGLRQ